MRYAIVVEKEGNNYSAYVPDLPGCVATGSIIDDGLPPYGLLSPRPVTCAWAHCTPTAPIKSTRPDHQLLPRRAPAQLLMDLSLNLRSVVAQRLIPLKDGKERAAAIEVMLNSPLIADLIFKGHVHEIKDIMKKSKELGMQTFDMALFELYEAGKISYEDALRNADSMNELRLKIKLESNQAQSQDLNSGIAHLEIT